ncbi:MAG: GNAT family N-acetyltransferase [Planctomycetota bacterium]
MALRTFARSDAAAVRRLWNDVAEYDQLHDQLLAEKIWDDCDYDPQHQLAAVRDGQIVGIASWVARSTEQGQRAYLKFLAVDSRAQRRGIGSQLLDAIEQQAWRLGAEESRLAESAPNYLTPGVDSRYAEAIRFFERRGYERLGTAVNMQASLDALPKIDSETNAFAIRRASSEDAAPMSRLLAEHWPSWSEEIAVALENEPPTLFVAYSEGRLLGFAAYDSNNQGTGWFGPMGTDPAVQGQGVGKALLLESLHAMRTAGYREAVIPWVGPVNFYRKTIGAQVTREFVRLRKRRPSDWER